MSLGAEHTAGGEQRGSPGWPLLPTVLIVAGVAAAAIGVALNESGVTAGPLLIVGGLPLAALGGAIALLRRERRLAEGDQAVAAVRETDATIAEVARRLGMQLHDGRASGTVNRRHVELWPEQGGAAICVFTKATRELDMGLSVTRGRLPGDARKEVLTGDDAFDAIYCVRADDPDRGRQILTDRLRAQLLHAHAQLDDSGVQLLAGGGDPEAIALAMKTAAQVTAELERASGRVHCAEPLCDVREAWLTFAQENSLASADTPLSMWGQIDGVTVSATAVRDAFQHFHFELVANFAAPLGRGLGLKPASSATQFDRSGEPVGHPAFDKIFVLKATDPTDAARLVGPETREAILQLRDHGLQLRARDEGLWAWVGLNRTEPDLVPRGLRRMVQIANRITSNAERFPPSVR